MSRAKRSFRATPAAAHTYVMAFFAVSASMSGSGSGGHSLVWGFNVHNHQRRIYDASHRRRVMAFDSDRTTSSSSYKHVLSSHISHLPLRYHRRLAASSAANDSPSSAPMEERRPAGAAAARPQSPDLDSSSQSVLQWLNDAVWFRAFVQWLAQLSLADYKWRSNLFKTNQADRMEQEALARMQGDTPLYVRPMDAAPTSMGPLGQWEQAAVTWLSSVMDEEGRRAQRIVEANGKLVRPSDNAEASTISSTSTSINEHVESSTSTLGPLGRLERTVVEFLAQIQQAETERVRTKTWRPKDLDEQSRGPLGQLEFEAVQTLEEIRASETLRARQIRERGGEMVRPIDIPGPLGEWERQVGEVMEAERRRFRERKRNDGRIVRPKDASWQGPLGEAEATAFAAFQSVSTEEMERLRNIQRSLAENRPMESDRTSFLGVAEALVVGILRGPALLWEVWHRVGELLSSSTLDAKDQDRLRQTSTTTLPPPSDTSRKPSEL